MAQSLDHLILVGFTKVPDGSTEQGEMTIRKLSDAANVAMKNIHFFNEGTDQMEIIKGSFKKDKTKRFGYDFGNSVIIVSGAVSTSYRLKMKQMKKIDEIEVNLDYQDVDFSSMRESYLSEWVEKGYYEEKSTTIDSNDEDPIASILGIDEESNELDDFLSDDGLQDAHPEQSSNAYEIDDEDVLFEDEFEDEPSVKESVPEAVNEEHRGKHEAPQSSLQVENNPYEIEEDGYNSDLEEEPLDVLSEGDEGFFAPQNMELRLSQLDEDQPQSDLEPSLEDKDRRGLVDAQLDKLDREYLIDDSATSQSQNGGDNEYIEKMKENRQKKLKKQKNSMRESLLSEIGNMKGAVQNQPQRAEESFSDRANAIAGDRREDGSRKSFKDYLSETDRRTQEVEEQTIRDFGDFRTGKSAVGQDSHYTGVNMGRVILVTSGKGGVGKSIVANGMAMALSLARASNLAENPGANNSTTWLIESDWNSPKLCESYQTGRKHLGNVAAVLATEEGGADAEKLRQAIIENTYVDEETGLHILACPPLGPHSPTNSRMIGYAILRAIDYAVKNNGSVIVDHGNLTAGVYSSFDNILSTKIAHRVVVVADMGCLPETQSILSMLTQRGSQSRSTVQDVMTVSVVLNKAREEQYYVAQDRLKPFEIIQRIPPLADLQPENIVGQGRTGINNASDDVKRSIITRCGVILTKLGYEDLRRYFSTKNRSYNKKSKQSRSFLQKIADKFSGDS